MKTCETAKNHCSAAMTTENSDLHRRIEHANCKLIFPFCLQIVK